MRWLWLILAGGLGALCRFGAGAWVQARFPGSHFPYGTACVNVLGCFLFGLLWVLGEREVGLSAETRVYVLTGFMGAFTTFSTYAFESARLLEAGHYALAAGNMVGQNLLGLGAVLLGMAVAARV